MRSVEEEYWSRGLHDATIEDIQCGELTPDYKEKNYRYNYLQVTVDAADAIYDTTVKEIIFYNYTAERNGERIHDLSRYVGCWWLGDHLEKKAHKYVLQLKLRSIPKHGKPINETLTIKFEQLKVIREE